MLVFQIHPPCFTFDPAANGLSALLVSLDTSSDPTSAFAPILLSTSVPSRPANATPDATTTSAPHRRLRSFFLYSTLANTRFVRICL